MERPTGLVQAIAEIGQADKIIHAQTCFDDENTRRKILQQINRRGRMTFSGQINNKYHFSFSLGFV